jgi:hypothetical protein
MCLGSFDIDDPVLLVDAVDDPVLSVQPIGIIPGEFTDQFFSRIRVRAKEMFKNGSQFRPEFGRQVSDILDCLTRESEFEA